VKTFEAEPKYARGIRDAAAFVVTNSESPVIFFDGYFSGPFVYNLRKLDQELSMIVLRGDKMLSSAAVSAELQLRRNPKGLVENEFVKVKAQDRNDIEKIFRDYGVKFIVVEVKNYSPLPMHQELRKYLEGGPFELVWEQPIKGNMAGHTDNAIRVYRFLDAQPMTAEFLELDLPIVGQLIRIPTSSLRGTDFQKKVH